MVFGREERARAKSELLGTCWLGEGAVGSEGVVDDEIGEEELAGPASALRVVVFLRKGLWEPKLEVDSEAILGLVRTWFQDLGLFIARGGKLIMMRWQI